MSFKQVGSLMVPSDYPEKVGLGCPRCDQFVLVSVSTAGSSNAETTAFLRKHADCGPLEQLEERQHGGKLRVTGTIDPGAES